MYIARGAPIRKVKIIKTDPIRDRIGGSGVPTIKKPSIRTYIQNIARMKEIPETRNAIISTPKADSRLISRLFAHKITARLIDSSVPSE
jgi:hypothetical protein